MDRWIKEGSRLAEDEDYTVNEYMGQPVGWILDKIKIFNFQTILNNVVI